MVSIQISAEKILSLWFLPISNTLLTTWLVILVLILLARFLEKHISLVPAFFQNSVEWAIETLLDFMEKVFHSRDKALRYFPLIATIFIFVLLSNWMGIIPGIGSIGFYRIEAGVRTFVPLFRSSASDLNFTLAIALISVVATNVYAVTALGFRTHLSKFFSLKSPLSFFIGILELIGELAKLISFSFRLFGNIFAGEVLLIITGFLVPYLIPVPFLVLELFVGFIQALVFATLTLVFISIAIEVPAQALVETHP